MTLYLADDKHCDTNSTAIQKRRKESLRTDTLKRDSTQPDATSRATVELVTQGHRGLSWMKDMGTFAMCLPDSTTSCSSK